MTKVILLIILSSPLHGASINQATSALFVVTHRGGMIASMGHNHVVEAHGYSAAMEVAKSPPLVRSLSITVPTQKLINDDPKATDRLWPLIEQAGLLKEKPSEVSKSSQKTIREGMLDEDQLHLGQYPTISGSLVSYTSKGDGNIYQVKIKIRDKEVEATCEGPQIASSDGKILLNFVCPLKFTDFGIEPISVMMGAVKNQDQFHLVANFEIFP